MMDTVIEIHGKKVLLLEHAIERDVLPDPSLADLWVVNHEDESLVKRFLYHIIRSKDLRVYLKPVFLKRELKKFYTTKDYHLKHLCDGYIDGFDFVDKIPFIDQIEVFLEKNGKKVPFEHASDNDILLQKCFNYYYTRKKKIKPILEHKSLSGYSYPRIESYFSNTRDAFITSRMLLQEAYNHGWLAREYVDTSHLCKSCSSGFLNYREVCPKCNGHNLKASSLIHHFRCAYVGDENDFLFKNKLICPKCSSELKNIGVDYDKPGKVYSCNSKKCNHEFQDAPIGVHCVDCETEQFPEDLVVRKIYEYKITSLGIQKGLLL